MLGKEGSVHKQKENHYCVDRDFRQLGNQSSEVCSTCAGFGIATSVYTVQGRSVTIQSFLLEWRKVSNAGLRGKGETA